MNELEKASQVLDECWDIFSLTGNCEDARMMIDAINDYDCLLEQDFEAGL